MKKVNYYFAKLLYKLQRPALKDCVLSSHVKVLPQSNLLRVTIGKYTYIGKLCTMQDVIIGAFCSVGSFVSVGGGVHPTGLPSTSPVFYDKNNIFKKSFLIAENNTHDHLKTIIGNDVWIGDSCYIKAGVSIGDGAILGAHSVITHDIPPYAIVAGVPARVIRYRFDETIIEALMKIKWWLWEDDKIEEFKNQLSSPTELLTLL